MPRRILVTAALPYVNGHIHIGHLVEHVQTDVWVRFQRLMGHQVTFLCADDVHGTATMIAARKRGVPEAAIVAEMGAAHRADFRDFDIDHAFYGSTDSPRAKEFVYAIWQSLTEAGLVVRRSVTQLFDPQAGCFLADRFVKGSCPVCGAADQNGDSCDKCGATYAPTDLKDPRSTLSGAVPEVRSAEHCFVRLEDLRVFLEDWTQRSGALSGPMARWVKGAFLAEDKPLRDWDVSRPAPYFGFEIPDAPGHYFYVWVDAPVGYVGALADWCAMTGEQRAQWWPRQGEPGFAAEDTDIEIHHFIGKDITYFHTLFWPAMLKVAGWKLPKQVHIHGWLTVNGDKMSKSSGTFINARTYLEAGLDPAYVRYYFASKLNGSADDLDLNLQEFIAKVNSDIIGKVVNLASRTARFVPALAATYPDDGGLFFAAAKESEAIAAAYAADNSADALRRIMALADRANEYVEKAAPWALKKDPGKNAELTTACTIALNLFRQLAIYLAPVLPRLAEQAGTLFARPISAWTDAQAPLVGITIQPFAKMLDRVDPEKVARMVELSTAPPLTPLSTVEAAGQVAQVSVLTTPTPEPIVTEPLATTISFDDFAKLDLRVATVLSAEDVSKAKKIVKVVVDLGSLGQRTIFAGIKAAFPDVSVLVGRRIIVVANLAPRTMSFGVSEGMIIAAGEGAQAFLLAPDPGAVPGMRVH